MKGPAFERREILFLQGPPGSFFRDLAEALDARGHGVHRINFNGGDLLDWRGEGVNYAGGDAAWPVFLTRLVRARGITDLVLFGDCRPLHRNARAAASGLGLTVHVFEEGYVRPDWVTLERGGVNGFSDLPADPQWYRDATRSLGPVPERPRLPSAIGRRARASVLYNLAAVLTGAMFPRYRTHRPWHPAVEAAGWMRRTLRRRLATPGGRDPAALEGEAYFLLPLQLDSDYQLRAHSDYGGMQPALVRILTSFARHASQAARLVVKEHPLDNGLRDWRRRTLDCAGALNIADRVVFLEDGDIDGLVAGAQGVVTVNSTTGTLALAAGVPVITLGRAVYDIAGLTHQGSLDTFWRARQQPDPTLFEAFRRVLADRCLLWGGFYAMETRSDLALAAADRILDAVGKDIAEPGEVHEPFVSPSMIAAE